MSRAPSVAECTAHPLEMKLKRVVQRKQRRRREAGAAARDGADLTNTGRRRCRRTRTRGREERGGEWSDAGNYCNSSCRPPSLSSLVLSPSLPAFFIAARTRLSQRGGLLSTWEPEAVSVRLCVCARTREKVCDLIKSKKYFENTVTAGVFTKSTRDLVIKKKKNICKYNWTL